MIMRFGTLGLLLAVALRGGATDEAALLWQPPRQIAVADWIWGPGGEAGAPRPPFEFLEEDFKGTNPKIRVRDAKGDRWTVKFGGENHSDVFASRFLLAMGYESEASYFIRSGVIENAHGLKRAKPFLGKHGEFSYARFKLHESVNVSRVNGMDWSWTSSPFVGTHELNGLKILMMLMSNWDGKDARDGKGGNTAVYTVAALEGDRLYYVFDDWGSSFGKWGGFFSRDKWDADGYRSQTRDFVRACGDGNIRWGYRGKHDRDITAGVSIDDVRWLVTYLSAVTDEDLRAGLQASGATPTQVATYTRSIRERIVQLQHLAAAGMSR